MSLQINGDRDPETLTHTIARLGKRRRTRHLPTGLHIDPVNLPPKL